MLTRVAVVACVLLALVSCAAATRVQADPLSALHSLASSAPQLEDVEAADMMLELAAHHEIQMAAKAHEAEESAAVEAVAADAQKLTAANNAELASVSELESELQAQKAAVESQRKQIADDKSKMQRLKALIAENKQILVRNEKQLKASSGKYLQAVKDYTKHVNQAVAQSLRETQAKAEAEVSAIQGSVSSAEVVAPRAPKGFFGAQTYKPYEVPTPAAVSPIPMKVGFHSGSADASGHARPRGQQQVGASQPTAAVAAQGARPRSALPRVGASKPQSAEAAPAAVPRKLPRVGSSKPKAEAAPAPATLLEQEGEAETEGETETEAESETESAAEEQPVISEEELSAELHSRLESIPHKNLDQFSSFFEHLAAQNAEALLPRPAQVANEVHAIKAEMQDEPVTMFLELDAEAEADADSETESETTAESEAAALSESEVEEALTAMEAEAPLAAEEYPSMLESEAEADADAEAEDELDAEAELALEAEADAEAVAEMEAEDEE